MYVQRNEQGEITGAYANPQAGYAEEYLSPDNEGLVAFLDAIAHRHGT